MLSATKCVPPAVLIPGLNWSGSADAAITSVPPRLGVTVGPAAATPVACVAAAGTGLGGAGVAACATAAGVGAAVGALGTAHGPHAADTQTSVTRMDAVRLMGTW